MVPQASVTFPTISLPSSPVAFAHPAALLLLGLAVLLFVIQRASLRGLTPERQRVLLALRLALLFLLVAGLAGPVAVGAPGGTAVAFLVDRSDSMSAEQQARALEWVRQGIAAKGARDQAQIIAFAGDALIDVPLGAATDVAEIASTPAREHTNLAAALRLAMSTLPSKMARRIVVLSDGEENAGGALDEARLAAAAGIPISFVPLGGREGQEVMIRDLVTPAVLREQDTFSVKVTAEANVATTATLYLVVDGRLDSTHQVQLNPGSNVFEIAHAPLAKGFHSFEVRLEAAADGILENNEGVSYTMVLGQARLLVVEGVEGGSRFLVDALRAGGMDVTVRPPPNLPADPSGLREFDSVVLVNVPGDRLAPSQQRAIKTYVHALGGGLVVVGGSQSYGAGGYAGTPLEEALPVRMDLHSRKLQSSVALMLVIDTSGSMAEGPRGATKMDLAKKAALESVALLGEQDQIAVLAFEDAARWVVEPTFVTEPDEMKRKLGTLAPGGGTEIFSALREAYRVMAQREAKVRHIILMTDGLAPPGNYDELMAAMRRDGITLSTIAIGTDADFGLLQRLAEQAKGRYYEGIDPFDVPRLTVKETIEVSRAAIVEEKVQPLRTGASAILEGLDLAAVPPLAGYVATVAKPSSSTVLVSKQEDPLLVEWQYGLGQVVAWTSDAENRWATDWLTWPQFAQFWAQTVKRTIPAFLDRNIHVSIQQDGAQARIAVDATSDEGKFVNGLRTEANVVDPSGGQRTIVLRQTAPGRYEGTFPATGQGAYGVEVAQRRPTDGSIAALQPSGFVVPYSPEYRDLAGNSALLAVLAEETTGGPLASPAEAFVPPTQRNGGGLPLWPYLIATAVLVFLMDIAVRRLRVEPSDLRRGWRQLRETWRTRSDPITRPASARLLAVKRRLEPEHGLPARSRTARERPRSGVIPPRAQQANRQNDATDAPAASATLGARLIEAKRRAGREKQ